MEIKDILEILFQLVIIPIIPLITLYLKKLIESKIDEIQVKSKNEVINKYLQLAEEGITKAVMTISQTYVESLKKEGKFDKEAQVKAFEMAREEFERIVNDEIKNGIRELTSDYDAWIKASIESMVKETK